ncbi:hypothetical protein [Pilimelia columellifera]|uniref:hypothetical protein n=1 Tax=Pilimelia columellifera TaxID=706574 RepID=UPI0031D1E9BE
MTLREKSELSAGGLPIPLHETVDSGMRGGRAIWHQRMADKHVSASKKWIGARVCRVGVGGVRTLIEQ